LDVVKPDAYRAGVGGITISTPKVTRIYDADAANRLDYKDLKKESEIQKTIQQANVSIANAEYNAQSLALALKFAGSQLDSSTITKLNTPVTGGDLQSSQATGSTEATSTETFKSPGEPTAAALPTLPADAATKLYALLSGSTKTYRLDPRQEAILIAAYKTMMVNLEEYYNMTEMVAYAATKTDPALTVRWTPYRVQFTLSVDPGWYSFLKHHDAVSEVTLGFQKEDGTLVTGIDNIKILNVTPIEAAQTLDELSSSFDQFASALTASGAFQAVGFQSAFNNLQAAARRLEGFRRNSLHLVSFPQQDKVRIRVRPAIVANNANSELQGTSILFTATVLIKDELLSPTSPPVPGIPGAAAIPSLPYSKIMLASSHKAFFEPQTSIVRKRAGLSPPRYFYGAPDSVDRAAVMYAVGNGTNAPDVQEFRSLVPAPEDQSKPRPKFGMTIDSASLYDTDPRNTKSATAQLIVQITNPDAGNVQGMEWDAEGKSTDVLPSQDYKQESFKTVLQVKNLPGPDDNSKQLRFLVRLTRAINSGGKLLNESQVYAVSLPHRYAPTPATPSAEVTVAIDRSGVKVDKLPLDDISAAKLRALLGDQIWIASPK